MVQGAEHSAAIPSPTYIHAWVNQRTIQPPCPTAARECLWLGGPWALPRAGGVVAAVAVVLRQVGGARERRAHALLRPARGAKDDTRQLKNVHVDVHMCMFNIPTM